MAFVPAAQAIQFTVDQSSLKEAKKQNVISGAVHAAVTPARSVGMLTPSSSLTPSNLPQIYTFHQCSCQRTKKQLLGALEDILPVR